MAIKKIPTSMALDDQVERYLRVPITKNYMIRYVINRLAGDDVRMTIEFFVDHERFNECGKSPVGELIQEE